MSALPELRELQRWFAHVVEHPRTADVALRSDSAKAIVPLGDVRAGRVIEPNSRMDAAAMLQVYNGGYLARLVEVLQGEFAAVHHVLGDCAFQELIAKYLARFPSRHPNLNRLGRDLAAFVKSRRGLPHRAFLADLAQLEDAVSVAFDAPEFEPLAADALSHVPQEQWDEARFTPNPSLRLLALRHPVDEFYQPWKQGEPVEVPAPSRSYVAVFRNGGRVWRQRLGKSAFTVLSALASGEPLGDALARAKPGEPVGEWFQGFAADGLFTSVDVS